MTGFLDLPGELRNIIYKEHFSQVLENTSVQEEVCALLCACPEIRSEALTVCLLVRCGNGDF